MRRKATASERLGEIANRSTLAITTRGRKSGKPHTVTTWFLVDGATVYLATMNLKRDWARNLRKNGFVELDVGSAALKGRGVLIADAKRLGHVSQLLQQKYWAAWLAAWIGIGPDGAFAVSFEG